VGEGAPIIDKLPPFWSHPGFVAANSDRVAAALSRIPEDRRAAARLVFTAHSIPVAMSSTCGYEGQLEETARRVAAAVCHEEWDLVWQSRSGPTAQPWLEPDILDQLRALADNGVRDVVVSPIGFLSDHMEVMYDLDHEAAALSSELGINFVRAATAGTHPAILTMLRDLIQQHQDAELPLCASDCCPAPVRRPVG
jgi:ferrochelatase